jgi:hypothetical protein
MKRLEAIGIDLLFGQRIVGEPNYLQALWTSVHLSGGSVYGPLGEGLRDCALVSLLAGVGELDHVAPVPAGIL